jgi:hypothetical protein
MDPCTRAKFHDRAFLQQDLETLESAIRKNLSSFYEVGRALLEIRDRKLYCDVAGHETFEAYCRAE